MGNPTQKPSNGTSASSIEGRLDAAEARIDQLEQEVHVLKGDGRAMRAALSGAAPTPIANPHRRRSKLTPEQRRAIRVQTAKAARASKPIGTGKGAVRPKTKTKKKGT